MAERILLFFLSLPQLSGEQAWALFVFLASAILFVHFIRQVLLRCDS
jgi:hypothetical protein